MVSRIRTNSPGSVRSSCCSAWKRNLRPERRRPAEPPTAKPADVIKLGHQTGSEPMTESSSDKFDEMIRPEELRKITEEKEMAELRQVLEHQKKVESEQKDVYQAFLNQHVHPEAKARITAAVRRAAE